MLDILEDFILVRGIRTDVDRAVKEILRIVEDAKTEQINNSYVSSWNPSYTILVNYRDFRLVCRVRD